MSYYFDYIPGAVQWSTAALDPTNEIGTFLSYKLTDWCNKVGPNYAFIRNDHTRWLNVTNTSDTWIDVGLLGPDYRSGATPLSFAGISLRRRYSDRWYLTTTHKPRLIDQAGSYYDPNNYRRDTNGNMDYNDGGTYEYGYADNYFQTNDFQIPRPTYVLYSDTPGRRFFMWWINGYTGNLTRGGVVETKPITGRSDQGDQGWAFISDNRLTPIFGTWDDDSPQDYRYAHVSNNVYSLVIPNYGPNYPYSTSYSLPLMKQGMTRDAHGDVQSYTDYIYYAYTSAFNPLYTYRISGQKYMAWTESILVPIE